MFMQGNTAFVHSNFSMTLCLPVPFLAENVGFDALGWRLSGVFEFGAFSLEALGCRGLSGVVEVEAFSLEAFLGGRFSIVDVPTY
jgi:hypothetical protein